MMHLPVQADFHYLVPLRPGQRVAVFGFGEPLQRAVELEGCTLVTDSPDELKVVASLDAAFLMVTTPQEIFRVAGSLRVGGRLLLGFHNQHSLHRIKAANTLNGYSLYKVRRILQEAGLALDASYGVYDSLNEPRFLVPLENNRVMLYFFTNMLIPYTRSSMILQRLAPLMIRLGLKNILFADICLVTRTN